MARNQRRTIQVSHHTYEQLRTWRAAHDRRWPDQPTSWNSFLMLVSADALSGLLKCPNCDRWLKCDCRFKEG